MQVRCGGAGAQLGGIAGRPARRAAGAAPQYCRASVLLCKPTVGGRPSMRRGGIDHGTLLGEMPAPRCACVGVQMGSHPLAGPAGLCRGRIERGLQLGQLSAQRLCARVRVGSRPPASGDLPYFIRGESRCPGCRPCSRRRQTYLVRRLARTVPNVKYLPHWISRFCAASER